ncbi:MAG: hypothetical protein MI750_11400 [Xanthomonadales bacterium]|nr:hypothetical protein [Xanthomonadales bacterium]
MNGRVYDYNLGRFYSVDPFTQFPENSQSVNGYSYILNNPLSGTDPSGYTVCDANGQCSLGDISSSEIESLSIYENGVITVTTTSGEQYATTSITVNSGTSVINSLGTTTASVISPEYTLSTSSRTNQQNASNISQDSTGNHGGNADGMFNEGDFWDLAGGLGKGLVNDFADEVANTPFFQSPHTMLLEHITGAGLSGPTLNSLGWFDGQAFEPSDSNLGNLGEDLAPIIPLLAGGGGLLRDVRRNGDSYIESVINWFNPCHCFVAGTLVLTYEGLVPIEELEVGDIVASRSEKNGFTSWRPITQLFRFEERPTLTLTLMNSEGEFDEFVVTHEHPFWVESAGWVEASSLEVGALVVALEEEQWTVAARTENPGFPSTYNFEVEDFHTYFVGESGVWVHNTCGKRPPNLSPEGAGRRGAFQEAKRRSGVPVGMEPYSVGPNYDKRDKLQPGRVYTFKVPKQGGGTRDVIIRDDAGGHYYGPNDPQNRGPHFNDENDDHYDY